MSVIEDILDKARWFYIPYKPYKTFYHLIVENDVDDWTFYYLDKQAESAEKIRDVSGMLDGIGTFLDVKPEKKTEPTIKEQKAKFLQMEVPAEYSDGYVYDLFRQIEKSCSRRIDIDRNISGSVVIRKVHGNLGAMIHEFQKVLK